MTDSKSTIRTKLDWIESLNPDPKTHSKNIIQFNREVELLIEYGNEAVAPLTEKLFKSNNRYMLWASAWILREIGDASALDALWFASRKYKPDIGLQHEFILGICMLKDKKISDTLLKILKERNSSLVATAIRGLGILQENRAVPLLVDLFTRGTKEEYSIIIPKESKNPGVHVKQIIIEALGEIQTEESTNELNNILHLDTEKFSEFQHFDRIKCDVIVALATNKNQVTQKIISDALKHPTKGVRKMAKRQLDNWNR